MGMKAASRERSLMASKSKKKVSNAAPILPFGASDAETKEYERALSVWLEEKALAENAAKTGAKRPSEVNTRESGSPGLASGPSSDERRGRSNEDYSDAASYSESVSGAALMKAASRERSLMASKSKKKVSNA